MMEEKVLYAVIYFAEALIAWQFFGSLFPSSSPFWARCVLYGGAYIIAYLAFAISIVPINTLLFAACNFMILMLGYQVKWGRAILHAFLFTGLMLSTEFLTLTLLGMIFQNFDTYQNNLVVLALFSSLSKFAFFLCTKLYVRIAKEKETDMDLPTPVVILLALCSVASIVLIFSLFFICLMVNNLPAVGGTLIICSGLGLLLVNILLFTGYQYLQRINKNYRDILLLQQKSQADKEYYTALQEQYDSQRILIHDIRHHLGVIRELTEKGDLLAVVQYVGEVEKLPALQKQVRYCADPILNAIVVRYHEVCQKKGIEFTVDIRHILLEFLEPVDITVLFGNLLENAVEATEDTSDPSIELSVISREERGPVLISVANTCKQLPVEDAGKFITWKQEKRLHGIGLQSVRRTVKKYDGRIEFYCTQNPQIFRALISFSLGGGNSADRS